jgi:hypothetical protein
MQWNFAISDITLEFWRNTYWRSDKSVEKVALKMVERLLTERWFAKLYVQQDRADVLDDSPTAVEEIDDTLEELQSVPRVLFDGRTNEYGYVEIEETNECIHVNKQLSVIGKTSRTHVVKFRTAFLMFATIVHELSHQKLRRHWLRESPKSKFPNLSGNAESGEWLEIQLFGGVVRSRDGAKNLNGGLYLKYKTPGGNSKKVIIDDSWLRNTVKRLLRDEPIHKVDLKIPKINTIQSNRSNIKRKRELEFNNDTRKRGRFVDRAGRRYIV